MRQELEKIRRRLEAELAEAREQLAEKTSQLDELQAMMNRREEDLQQALNRYVHRDWTPAFNCFFQKTPESSVISAGLTNV